MNSVPSQIKKLSNTQLKELMKVNLQGLPEAAVAAITEQIMAYWPEGTNQDWFRWGMQKGLLEAHKIYQKLAEHAKNEIENRKGETALQKLQEEK